MSFQRPDGLYDLAVSQTAFGNPPSPVPTWVADSELLQYFRDLEGREHTGQHTLHVERGEGILHEPTLPFYDWTLQPLHLAHSWMRSGEAEPRLDMAPTLGVDSMPTSNQITRLPTPEKTLQFVPRPVAEYEALMKGVDTGHYGRRTMTMNHRAIVLPYHGTARQFTPPTTVDAFAALSSDGFNLHKEPQYYIAAASHYTVVSSSQVDHAAAQSHRTNLKRKLSLSSEAGPYTPEKRPRLEDLPMQGGRQIIPREEGYGVLSLPSASQLIGKHRYNSKHVTARPWGLQRIITHAFVEQQATKLDTPMPRITDDDIYKYCYSPKSPLHIIRSTVPPEDIDLRFLGNIEISAEELLSFFPQHLKWHDAIYRLVQNGWTPTDMAQFINHARGLTKPNVKGYAANTLLKWLQAADKAILGKEKSGCKDRHAWKTTCFTMKGWVPCSHSVSQGLFDYFLVDLASGLLHWPEGDGARLLTRGVRFAVTRGHRDVKLSQIEQYVRANLLIYPLLRPLGTQMVEGEHPDTSAQRRARDEHHRRKAQIKEEQA